jgi:hypothetical protein
LVDAGKVTGGGRKGILYQVSDHEQLRGEHAEQKDPSL